VLFLHNSVVHTYILLFLGDHILVRKANPLGRKALIRKHHLALTVRHYVAKHPNSVLASSFPETCDFELDFAEFLDEALVEAYEVRQSLTENEEREPNERAWWILKPGMSDRGQGIRLFSTTEELTEIFESFEGDSDADEEDEGDTSVVTSQLRHFVAQKYVHPPLLVGNRKFHIRAYVLAVGGLKVYVYRRMLALFAAQEYSPPWENGDLAAHLTNTCLQTGERDGSVRLFWDLEKEIGKERLQAIWEKVCKTVGETFEGAARGQRVHFQVRHPLARRNASNERYILMLYENSASPERVRDIWRRLHSERGWASLPARGKCIPRFQADWRGALRSNIRFVGGYGQDRSGTVLWCERDTTAE
jgi:hypothetical protein